MIPPLGTGNLKYPVEKCVDCIRTGLRRFYISRMRKFKKFKDSLKEENESKENESEENESGENESKNNKYKEKTISKITEIISI